MEVRNMPDVPMSIDVNPDDFWFSLNSIREQMQDFLQEPEVRLSRFELSEGDNQMRLVWVFPEE